MNKASAKNAKNKPKVLIIDVNRSHISEIAGLLRKEGFRVTGCSAPRGVLGQIRRKRPDAVVVEVILPSMSGFEIAARMQADPRLSDIPILFTTDIQNSNGDNQDYFSRPLDMPSLVSALKRRTSTGA
jgi:PleD family two-component response regulator